MPGMGKRQFLVLLVATVVTVAGTVLAGILLLGDDDGDRVVGSLDEFVETDRCRAEGAAILEDAEAAVAVAPPDHQEAARFAELAGAGFDALIPCGGAAKGALSAAVEAARDYVDRASACQAAASFGESDCPTDDAGVLEAVVAARAAVSVARDVLAARA